MVSKVISSKFKIAWFTEKDINIKKRKNLSHFFDLQQFNSCRTKMDTMTGAVLSHFDRDLLNCTYSWNNAPMVKLIAIQILLILVPQLVDIFHANAGDAKDNDTLSLLWAHL